MTMITRHLLACALLLPLCTADLAFFVSCDHGSDAIGSGAQSAPFRSPARARDAVRAKRTSAGAAHATVFVAGLCELAAPLTLSAPDSNATWRAWPGGAAAIFSGGTSIPMPPGRNDTDVVVVDLGKLGFDRASLGELKARGYSGGSACIRLDAFEPSAAELSFRRRDARAGRADGAPADAQMELARFPNRAPGPSASTKSWETVGALANKSSFALSAGAKARAAQWAEEVKGGAYPLFAHGLWDWNWADSHRAVLGADATAGVLAVGDDDQADRDAPLKKGGRYYVYNALSELDTAGEYHVDPSSLTLRLLPPPAAVPAPSPGGAGTYHLSRLASVVVLDGASDVTLEGLEVRHARGAAVVLRGCARAAVRGCTVADSGMMGINVTGGANVTIADSDVALNGNGGVVLDGGNRTTLAPAGHVASNCTLHRNGRWIMNYAPSAFLGGVGNMVTRCKVYDGPQIGVFMQGNDHTLSGSEIFDLARQCSDCGAFYGGREWTYRGNRILRNFWHDIGSIFGGGTRSVYLDDMLSGFDIEGNRFDQSAADNVLMLGGGRNVRFVGNLLNGSGGVAFDNRGMGWAAGGCKAGGNPYDFLARVPYSDPDGPYAKYANMTNILSDDPCRPKYNELSNNVLCGNAKAITSTSAADIASWGSSATNNTYTAACPEASS
eukprot:g8130.t1